MSRNRASETAGDMVAEDIRRALKAHHKPTTTAQRRALSRDPDRIPRWIFGWLGRKKLTRAIDSTELRELTEEGRRCIAEPERIEKLLGGNAKFTRQVDERLGGFAERNRLPTESKRPWILADTREWRLNLWKDIRESKNLPCAEDRHTWVHHLRSSQAFALNLFVPLARSIREPRFAWAAEVWKDFFNGVTAVEFEYPAKGDPLEETTTGPAHRTRVDVRIACKGGGTALIEVKYTEPSFGACSAFYSEENEQSEICRGAGWNLERARLCYLTSAKGRSYFKDRESCFDFAAAEKYAEGNKGCPFRGGLYQVMRNAKMIDKAARGAEFVVVAPRANRALRSSSSLYGHKDMEAFLAWAVPGTPTRYLAFEDVMGKARNTPGAETWFAYMDEKYLQPLGARRSP